MKKRTPEEAREYKRQYRERMKALKGTPPVTPTAPAPHPTIPVNRGRVKPETRPESQASPMGYVDPVFAAKLKKLGIPWG